MSPARPDSTRPGYTMVEVMTALAIVSVLLTAMGSVIFLARQSIPQSVNANNPRASTALAIDTMAEELRTARYLLERTPTAVTLVLADRTGDGLPEVVHYAWGGTAGDPITRQMNGATPITYIDNVALLNLGFDTEQTTESYDTADVEGPEVVLSSHDNPATPTTFDITSGGWLGQYFVPAMPAEAVSWQVTRALLMARVNADPIGTFHVQFRPEDGSKKPTSTIIQQVLVNEWDLPSSFAWHEVTFDEVQHRSPGEGLCMVVALASADFPVSLQYDAGGGFDLLHTTDSGGGWTLYPNYGLQHYIYGKVTTRSPAFDVQRTRVTDVSINVTMNDPAQSSFAARSATLNRPEVLDAVWEADFDGDPTQLDLLGDGEGDFEYQGGGPFNTNELSDGVWHAGSVTLRTSASQSFSAVTTLEARFRDTVANSDVARVTVAADVAGDIRATFKINLNLESDNTQTLTLCQNTSQSTTEDLTIIAGLPSTFIDVRLVVDANSDTASLVVDGEHRGTFSYVRYSTTTNPKLRLRETGDAGEFDYVRLRNGGNFTVQP